MQTVSVDELNGYNSSLGLIYRWMQMAIETRKRDIIHRLSISKAKREERAEKEREAAERAEARAQAVAEDKEKWEISNKADIDKYDDYKQACDEGNPPDLEDGEEPPTKPVYDENYFFFQWDEDHPEVIIPDEVIDDVDDDWLITADRKESMVNDYVFE